MTDLSRLLADCFRTPLAGAFQSTTADYFADLHRQIAAHQEAMALAVFEATRVDRRDLLRRSPAPLGEVTSRFEGNRCILGVDVEPDTFWCEYRCTSTCSRCRCGLFVGHEGDVHECGDLNEHSGEQCTGRWSVEPNGDVRVHALPFGLHPDRESLHAEIRAAGHGDIVDLLESGEGYIDPSVSPLRVPRGGIRYIVPPVVETSGEETTRFPALASLADFARPVYGVDVGRPVYEIEEKP